MHTILNSAISPNNAFEICEAMLYIHHPDVKKIVAAKADDIFNNPELSADINILYIYISYLFLFNSNVQVRNKILYFTTKVAHSFTQSDLSTSNENAMETEDKSSCIASIQHLLHVFTELSKANKLNWSTRRDFLGAIKTILRMENIEGFETLADLFLKGIKDDDLRVRIFMAKAISVFFDLFEDEEGILRDINKNLPIENEKNDVIVTSLVTLGEIACVSIGNTKEILFQLCSSLQGGNSGVIQGIFGHISKTLKYPSVQSLVEYHLEFMLGNKTIFPPILMVLGKWVSHKKELATFPIFLFQVEDFPQFVKRYVNIILTVLVFQQDKDTMLQVAQSLNKDLTELMK